MDHNLISKAKLNGRSSGQFFIDERINVSGFIDMLSNAVGSNHVSQRINAKQLFEELAANSWVISAGPHEGGKGDKERKPDQNKHITLKVNGKKSSSYHVQLDNKNHIWRITGGNTFQGNQPWEPPGSIPKG